MKILTDRILKSAQRLSEAEGKLEETKDPAWLWFIRKESSLLLRRGISFWIRIRFRKVI